MKIKKPWWMFGLLLAFSLSAGCGNQGKVDQGRVIEFDKDKGTVTLIRDSSPDSKNPDYSILPPLTYTVPQEKEEMGADPEAGYRMKLDSKKGEIVIFDPTSQNFRTIRYVLMDQKENIARDDALVFDKATKQPRKFPRIDQQKKTITLYSPRQKLLITFSVADADLALPDKFWKAGDEVRIYYKEKGNARRLMNISKTDIFEK